MSRAHVREICEALPGATLEHSFGPDHDVWKIGGKMFAIIGAMNDGVSLKCKDPETAAFLIDLNIARPAPYLKRGGWVQIPWEGFDPSETTLRLRQSYQTVRASLPKKVQAALPPSNE